MLSLGVESDRNEKNRKKIASQSAQGVVREESDPTPQKENKASKEGGNTSQARNGKSESTSLDEKGSSPESKNKISRKVAPYASGAGAWAVNAATKEPKQTYKMVSQIDPRRSISEILEGTDMSDPETRAAVVAFMSNREEVRYQAVLAKAELLGIPVRLDGPGHKVSILYDFRGEEPLYRTTLNANAAISTCANLIRQTAPYNLDGAGIKVGVWDAGSVRNTHQEFNTTRVVNKNSTVAAIDHATHVAGTIGASGFQASAKGMAPLVAIDSYDWLNEIAEMGATGAATANDSFAEKISLSNHSYGFQNPVFADMGRYEVRCNELDALALSLPYYLVFWAAGNERDVLTASGGYQSITHYGLAKNILTVGAGDDAVASGIRDVSKGTLASFSSMGPCDDGRIKPDLVANGVSLYSSISTSDTAYAENSGSSMASPNAAGSATLLVQLYSREFSNQRMRSSMLKALLIHTADDVGRPGPDYQYGWGYLNVKSAADVILAHKGSLAVPKMVDDSISNASETKSYLYQWDGSSPLRATLCWTDPAGAAQTERDSRIPNLKHNLDLKITAPDGTTIHQPYTMPFVGKWTQASMTENANKGKNNVDNVERVDVPTPTQAGTYIVTVSLDGMLTTSTQAFSLVVTGASSLEATPPPTVSVSGALAPVNTTYGAASLVPTSFTVSGSNLTEAISINAPSGYEISQTAGGASGYAPVQTVGAAGTVVAKTIYVRLRATTPFGIYSGNITCNSVGSAGATVATAASSVAKKQFTITANNQTKLFGTVLTLGPGQKEFIADGLVTGETIDTVTLVASGGTEAQDPVGLYTLAASDPVGGASSLFRPENYECTFVGGKLNVVAGGTFASWAGEGVAMTPELLMRYAIGGAANSLATGELPVVGMDGSNLTLTAIVRKDSTLKVEGQAVANLVDYGTPASVTSITGTSQGVIQGDVPSDCERRIFKSTLTGSRSFLRISVQKQ
jgi:hypothetical protein